MAMTKNRGRGDRHRDDPRAASRREMAEGLILLAAIVLLAAISRLPAG